MTHCESEKSTTFFRHKALDEPGFEITKPSTGQELQHTYRITTAEPIQWG